MHDEIAYRQADPYLLCPQLSPDGEFFMISSSNEEEMSDSQLGYETYKYRE